MDLGQIQHPASFKKFKPSPQCKPSRVRRRQRRMRDCAERDSRKSNIIIENEEKVRMTEVADPNNVQTLPVNETNTIEADLNFTSSTSDENELLKPYENLNQLSSADNKSNLGVSPEPTKNIEYLEDVDEIRLREPQSPPPEPTLKDVYDHLKRIWSL